MMYLDRKLAKKLTLLEIKKEKKNLESVALALQKDEFWNHETIWKKGKWKRTKNFKCYFGSYWATPIIIFYYKDGKEQKQPCYFNEEEKPKLAKRIKDKHNEKMKLCLKRLKDLKFKN